MLQERTDSDKNISGTPIRPYRESVVRHILDAADSYLDHADRLIYSGGGRTFLSGYDLFDAQHGDCGNIDCSTFILLVLAGIPYGNSPYGTGTVNGLNFFAAPWSDPTLADFQNLPDSYRGVAEIIGRPDLVGDEGVDLEKAKASGIDWKAVHEKMAGNGLIRRAHQIARYFWGKGECFSDGSSRRPGDLVFFRATPKWEEGYRFFGIFREIAHVGIVSRDTGLMYNSSGFIDKTRNIQENRPAVSLTEIYSARRPVFFARPEYRVPSSAPDPA